jgi:hypothetical protein
LFRDPDVTGGLEIEPELRARAEPVTKAQRRVAGDAALTLDFSATAMGTSEAGSQDHNEQRGVDL